MPRYFFDRFDNGTLQSRDNEGSELRDLESARNNAASTLADFANARHGEAPIKFKR